MPGIGSANPIQTRPTYCSRVPSCASLNRILMRRAQAVLAVLALAGLPLVMLAQLDAPSGCDGICCVRRPAHSRPVAGASQNEGMSCHRGAMGHIAECGMRSHHRTLDFGILAPIPPAMLSSFAMLFPPSIHRSAAGRLEQYSPRGFMPDFFEPPRS